MGMQKAERLFDENDGNLIYPVEFLYHCDFIIAIEDVDTND